MRESKFFLIAAVFFSQFVNASAGADALAEASVKKPHLKSISAMGATAETSLAGNIERRLQTNRNLGPYSVVIEVHNQSAIINGTVSSPEDRVAIAQIVKDTSGIATVINNIQIASISDEQLFERVKNALAGQRDLNLNALEIKVSSGNVLLNGNQSSFRDIDKILAVVLNVDGVKDIHNNMTVNGRPYMEIWGKR
jgi:osmotically-inducible protein OsmY